MHVQNWGMDRLTDTTIPPMHPAIFSFPRRQHISLASLHGTQIAVHGKTSLGLT